MTEIISRPEARAAGLRHYFTGAPCKRGHAAPRYVDNMTCTACDLARHIGSPSHAARCRAYYASHREAMIASQKARDAINADHVRARKKARRDEARRAAH